MKTLLVVLALSVGALAQSHGIGLTWTPSTATGVTTQILCRSTTAGTENCATPLVTFTDNTTAAYLDTTGTPGTTYFYIAEACIGTVCSVPSDEASAVFPTVPSPPTNLGAAPR